MMKWRIFYLISACVFTVHLTQAQIDPKLYSKQEKNPKGLYFTIADANKNPDKVVELNLSTRGIYNIPKVILHYHNLKILRLNDNYITKIPYWFASLRKVSVLDLSSNHIITFPAILLKLKKLDKLDLRVNKLEDFEPLTSKSSVSEIELSLNKLDSLPSDFSQFVNLKVLKIESNRLLKIPSVIFKLNNLEQVDLYHNQISFFDSHFVAENKLRFIYLARNPIEISEIQKLRKLLPNCRVSIEGV